jgi:hypothetical protein
MGQSSLDTVILNLLATRNAYDPKTGILRAGTWEPVAIWRLAIHGFRRPGKSRPVDNFSALLIEFGGLWI